MENRTRIGGRTNNVISGIAYKAARISAICVFLMMVLTFCDVIGRYFLGRPIKGASDLTELIMLIVVFLGLGYTQVVRGHVQVDALIRVLPKHIPPILEPFTSFLGAGILALISWRLGMRSWVALLNPHEEATPTLGIPLGPFLIAVTFGCLVFCVLLFWDFFHSLSRLVRK